MADPVTNNYSLVLPTVGGDTNVWGGILNNGVIQGADNALGGVQAVAMSSTDVTLTAAQFQNAIFVVTGALTANVNLIMPLSPNSATVACAGRFVVVNNTTGLFNLGVKTAASGSAVVGVPQGFAAFLYSDGTSVFNAHAGLSGFARGSNGNPNGQLAGTAGSINTNAQFAFDYTNGVLWVCTTTGSSVTAVWSQPNLAIRRGFDTAINLQINATIPANNLTVTLAAGDTGSAPTVLDPITVVFPSSAAVSGAPVSVNITSALSLATAAGASFGTTANTPFRLWLVLFYNGGTPVLGIINCSTPSGVFPLNEARTANSVLLNGASTSAGVFYTPGVTVTSSVFRIIGFIEYASTTLVTPGTYTALPDWVRLFGPGVKKPGEPIQTTLFSTNSANALSGALSATTVTSSITPTSQSNPILIDATATFTSAFTPNQGSAVTAQVRRGTVTVVGPSLLWGATTTQVAAYGTIPFSYFDIPNVTASQQYTVYANNGGGSPTNCNGGSMRLTEIMG